MPRAHSPEGRSPRALARAAGLVVACAAAAGCALIAGVPDVELAPAAGDATADTTALPPPADAGADTIPDTSSPDGADAAVDAGPRCRLEDAFERDVVEIGSLNVRGMCASVAFTADEKLAAVSSFVNGLGPTPETSWALFTLTRSAPSTYGGQIQQMVAASAAMRDDGLALVVAADTEGKGPLKEYARPRLDAAFASTGDIASLASFDTKRNAAYASADSVFFDGKRTAASAPQIFRLTRAGGALEAPQALDGLPAGAETPVPTRDVEWLYFSTCNPDAGTRCAPFRAKRTSGTTYGSVEPMTELGDFRPRWVSVDGCRLYGTRANRPAVATKLPR